MSIAHTLLTCAEFVTRREIHAIPRPRIRFPVHPKAVTTGQGMRIYADLVDAFCNFRPKNIFEIGANYGQDAEYLRRYFSLTPQVVFAFEPHPQIAPEIAKYYSFNVHDFAVSNSDGQATFNIVDVNAPNEWNTGISSLRTSLYSGPERRAITVKTRRMDSFIDEQNIAELDFVKIDVEGVNYEVLEGFGERLALVKAIQVEGELKACWEGQHLFADIDALLRKHDFMMAHYTLSWESIQCDSLWVQRRYLKGVSG